jgi:uncharacterized protein YdbL (DUF1318 family)
MTKRAMTYLVHEAVKSGVVDRLAHGRYQVVSADEQMARTLAKLNLARVPSV